MLAKMRAMAYTSLAAVFALMAVGTIGPACPILHYQPELPKRDQVKECRIEWKRRISRSNRPAFFWINSNDYRQVYH